MTDEEKMTAQKNTYRVALNLKALLNEGKFDGKHAMALYEAHQLVDSFIADVKKNMETQIVPPVELVRP